MKRYRSDIFLKNILVVFCYVGFEFFQRFNLKLFKSESCFILFKFIKYQFKKLDNVLFYFV